MLIIIIIIFLLILLSIYYYCYNSVENYNDIVGRYCEDCNNKINSNQCTTCFNCTWVTPGHCVKGDNNSGPYNKELNNNLWYSGDPYTFYSYNKSKNINKDLLC